MVVGFRRAWLFPKRNGRSKLAVATLKCWSGELSRLIYDVRMMKNGSELRCDRAAARSGSSGGGMKGVKGPALSSAGAPWFTVDDIFSLALVGAYRTTRARQWRARLTFCFELLPALARPVLSISPLRPLLHRARQCSILFCSIFILFCLFAFFFVALFFGSRSLFVAPSRDVDAYPPEFRGSRSTDLSSQLRQE